MQASYLDWGSHLARPQGNHTRMRARLFRVEPEVGVVGLKEGKRAEAVWKVGVEVMAEERVEETEGEGRGVGETEEDGMEVEETEEAGMEVGEMEWAREARAVMMEAEEMEVEAMGEVETAEEDEALRQGEMEVEKVGLVG